MKKIDILSNMKTLRSIFIAVMLFVFGSGILTAQTTVTIYSSADNTPDEQALTTNRGTCDRVYLTGGTGTRERGLFKFDLSSIPSSATITSGTLYLYRILGTGSGNVNVHRLTNDWTEGTATCVGTTGMVSNWNQRSTGTNWGTAGGDYNANVEATTNVPATTYTTNSWNIQSLIQGWVNATYSNYGLILKEADESAYNQMTFATREYTGTANDARLVVTYTTATPVELVSFNAKIRNQVVLLDWKTTTEVNNYGFEIERASSLPDGNAGSTSPVHGWEKIGFVNGHGNSNSPKAYTFEDSKLSNNSYEYRLKQVDNDGTFSYSNSVSVSLNQLPSNFALYQNFPNPFNPSTKISWQSPVSGWQTLKVYDILGNEVATLVNEFREAGFYETDFKTSTLTSGVYIYKINVGDPESSSGQAFSETKKMLLTK